MFYRRKISDAWEVTGVFQIWLGDWVGGSGWSRINMWGGDDGLLLCDAFPLEGRSIIVEGMMECMGSGMGLVESAHKNHLVNLG